MTIICQGCKQAIDICPYGGDCPEMQAIYREQQKQRLADIDLEDLDNCTECGCPIDKGYSLCYDCERGLREEQPTTNSGNIRDNPHWQQG